MGRRPIGAVAMTDAERKRRQRHVLHPTAPKPTPEALIRDLRADLDAMDRRLANRDAHIRELEAKLATAPAPAKAAPPKPNRKELKEETLREWYGAEIEKAGGMKIETFRALVRCLHPDTAPTAKQRAEASGLLTQYWQGRHGHRTKGRMPG